MEDLLVEVQAVHADLVLLPLATGGHFPWFEGGPGFAALPGRLQCDVPPGVAVEHSEEVVVGAGHDGTDGKSLVFLKKKKARAGFPRTVSLRQ